MICNSSVIKFLFFCFFFFVVFSGFLKEAVKVWKTFFFFNCSYLFYYMSTDECHLFISTSSFSSIRFSLDLPLIALPLHLPPLHLFRLFSTPFCFPSDAYLWILDLLWMRNYGELWIGESFWIFWLSLTSECLRHPLLQCTRVIGGCCPRQD